MHHILLRKAGGIDVFDEDYNLLSLFFIFCAVIQQQTEALVAATDKVSYESNAPFAKCLFMDLATG